MSKNIKLLLTESVDTLGIVGDVVNVRVGYARNFLLPRNLATTPSDEAIAAVAVKRAEAERQVAELRKEREALVKKLEGIEITIQRSCNDMGHLYASVTQQEIAKALADAGHPGVRPRDVRLHQNIKRVDTYDVHIKFEADMEATIKLWVVADRKLDIDTRKEEIAAAEAAAAAAYAAKMGEDAPAAPASDEKPKADRSDKPASKSDRAEKPGKQDRREKGEKSADAAKPDGKPEGKRDGKPEGKSEGKRAGKPDKGGDPKHQHKGGKGKPDSAAAEEPKKVSGWGKPVEKPDFGDLGVRRPRRDKGDKKGKH